MLNVGNLAKESETNVYLAKYINMVETQMTIQIKANFAAAIFCLIVPTLANAAGDNCYQIQNQDAKYFCLATAKNDNNYCYQISKQDDKYMCLAVTKRDKSYCYQISHQDDKNLCLAKF
jgi:hypothetical protein